MRAVLTGATGYIGGILCQRLRALEWEVLAVVMPGDAAPLPPGTARVEDPGTATALEPLLGGFKPDVVMHLAAAQNLDGGPAASDQLVAANLEFGARMLAAAEAAGARAFVAASTYSVHADGDSGYAPQTLYAATKAAFVTLAEHYRRNTGMAFAALELSDTYGPGDRRPKFLNLLARAAATGQRLEASPGAQLVRPIHVDDIASAFIVAAEQLVAGTELPRTVSVAGPDAVSLRELATMFGEATGVFPPVDWGARPYRPSEILRPWDGPGLPGWAPRIGLREGLASVYGDLTPWEADQA